MSSSAASAEHPSHPVLAFEDLPKNAQSLVCSFASAPSCPAHVLLSLVSKTWAAHAAEHLRLDGASIQLQLSCSTDYPLRERQKEVERLEGLAGWLQKNGHHLHTLSITAAGPDGEPEVNYVLEAGQVVPSILAALAAAGKRPGGLCLQHLWVPAFPSTPIYTICGALSGCRQLQVLVLDYSYSGQTTPAARDALEQLPLALQQLTQLVVLHLDGLFDYLPAGTAGGLPMDSLFRHLPSSLALIDICGCHPTSGVERVFHLAATSLQHLSALGSLNLPPDTRISTSSDQGNPLTQLTALTSLKVDGALRDDGAPLLALPQLATLMAGQANPEHLETLCGKTSLQVIAFALSPSQHEVQAATLAQATQLRGLALVTAEPEDDHLYDPEDEDEAGGEEEMLEATAEAAGAAISCLTGLRSLITEAAILKETDLAALTALTTLHIDLRRCGDEYSQDDLEELLWGLAPARGRLERVQLGGVAGVEDFDELECCEVLEEVLGGDVTVSFT